MKQLLAAAVLAITAQAHAQDAQDWGRITIKSYNTCSFVGSAARLMGNVNVGDIQKAQGCVDEHLEKARSGFQRLPPQSKPAAAAALKDYYAAWIAAMKAVAGQLTESPASADRAQNATVQRLNELWARYEIEAQP